MNAVYSPSKEEQFYLKFFLKNEELNGCLNGHESNKHTDTRKYAYSIWIKTDD